MASRLSRVFLLLAVCSLSVLLASGDDYRRNQNYQQQQQSGHRPVLLDDVKALTLRRGMMTTARRVSPVPQLQCVTGCEFEPEVVQCVNVGSNGVAVQWRCEADLPNGLQFGHTEVSCEGYDYPDDPRILYGSCGLQYSLVAMGEGGKGSNKNKGRSKKQQKQHQNNQQHAYNYPAQKKKKESGSLIGRLLTWAIITYIGVLAVRSCCCVNPFRRTGGTTWSGPAGGTFPPPPPPPPPHGGFDGPWGGPKTGYAAGAATPPPTSVPTWASAATGFGLGYLMGRRRPAPTNYPQQTAPNPWPRTSTSGSGSGDDDMHTSTAYASTSRR